MRGIAIILALGASIASAQPPDHANRADQNDLDRETSVNNQGWISLSSRNHIESAQEIVPVHERLRWLRIEPRSGRPIIQRLVVQFVGGGEEGFDIAARVSNSGITVDLHGERAVRGVIVFAQPDPNASYSLFGQKG